MKQDGLLQKGYKKTENGGKPLVSVITVVFNGEKHLERTIKSVINQTYERIEYIIIDGNSSDRTVEIIKKYDNVIDYWLSEEDNGIYDAFNKGLSFSTGDYIGFINSDDWYEPDGIKMVIDELKPLPAIYSGHMNLYSEEKHELMKLHKSRPDRIFQTMRIAHPATFVSRQIFNQLGGFSLDYKIAGDYDFMLRAKLRGFEFIVVNQLISNMSLGGISRDRITVFNEERIIKNRNVGVKIKHWLWYISNILFYYIYLKHHGK